MASATDPQGVLCAPALSLAKLGNAAQWRAVPGKLHKENLKPWYSNHLAFQTLSGFLAERETISKKYMEWIKELKEEKISLSSEIEKQAFELLKKVLV